MSNQTYHHGNLKKALIEAGIELFEEVGIQQFSLRKVATKCKVSHTAPYSHFKDKEELIEAMKEHASEQFADTLELSIQNIQPEDLKKQVNAMAKAYVQFFIDNPNYYTFIFEQAEFNINLDNILEISGFRAFEIFRKLSTDLLTQMQVPKDHYQVIVIQMWALVHGMAGIGNMKGIQFSSDWENIIEQIINGGISA